MVFAPQFWIRVLGITSSAFATALYGHWCTPVMLFAFSFKCYGRREDIFLSMTLSFHVKQEQSAVKTRDESATNTSLQKWKGGGWGG